MAHGISTDYETYREIMDELIRPIESDGLDLDTLKRLYESKYVYLENLRIKCFYEINSTKPSKFSRKDYLLILEALGRTKRHLHDLVVAAMVGTLARRKAV